MKFFTTGLAMAGMVQTAFSAYQLDITSIASVSSVTSLMASDMLMNYTGNTTGGTPGILPGPCSDSPLCYYWWEAGAMWALLINYAQLTGDKSHQDTVLQSLQWQIGDDKDYNPRNQSQSMGVDDQDFWGFAAMEAAEAGIPDVGGDFPSWLALGQAVWNSQIGLWDDATCNGGFRWQRFQANGGYNLKNTISNGGFFQLSARLARYTGNQTYVDWAEKVWQWMETSVLFDTVDNQLYIWDNTDADLGCVTAENHPWSYNYATLMVGAAYLYNMTNGNDTWGGRVQTMWNGAMPLFFKNGVMWEYLCEENVGAGECNNDQSSFKAYLSRWSAVTSLLAPFMYDQIMPLLKSSAAAVPQQCIGGANGRMCGRQWTSPTWDGSQGVGQQMSAMAVILATQVTPEYAPLSSKTGGKSVSDPNAGIEAPVDPDAYFKAHPITGADKFGASVLTILIIVSIAGMCVWIVI